MPVESAAFINGLVASNPAHTDGLAQADSHLRLIKSAVQASFPGITGAVTASQTDLNYTTGLPAVITALQTSDAAKAPLVSPTFTGTPTAPTAAPGDNTTKLATTAYVAANAMTSAAVAAYVAANAAPAFSTPSSHFTHGTYTFTIPAPQVEVELWGAGSGSWASVSGIPGGGGSAGGYTRKRISGLTVGSTVTITVGQGGTAGISGVYPTAGGATSFGSYCSASGGIVNPSNTLSNPASGNLGGSGSGGDINITGSDGAQGGGSTGVGGMGGAAPLGGGAVNSGSTGRAGYSPGGGASGAGTGAGGTTAYNGAAGADGGCIVRW